MTREGYLTKAVAKEMSLNLTSVNAKTIEHAKVINYRLNCGEGMAMAKSIMINELRAKMRQGTAHFWYVKMNKVLDVYFPEIREAWGTLSPNLMKAKVQGDGKEGERTNTLRYWDIEKGGFRSLRIENLLRVE